MDFNTPSSEENMAVNAITSETVFLQATQSSLSELDNIKFQALPFGPVSETYENQSWQPLMSFPPESSQHSLFPISVGCVDLSLNAKDGREFLTQEEMEYINPSMLCQPHNDPLEPGIGMPDEEIHPGSAEYAIALARNPPEGNEPPKASSQTSLLPLTTRSIPQLSAETLSRMSPEENLKNHRQSVIQMLENTFQDQLSQESLAPPSPTYYLDSVCVHDDLSGCYDEYSLRPGTSSLAGDLFGYAFM
ncbi:hypothetical protein CSUB01_10259 [Colletotrichum sublineola]|uniref:Uncharacterized protein n=1 Tax=Colletotrichum sublineola TaxID=1173701 RepID=A0A066XWD1_COLSU|nr:hypothetical protein CSUB01_10259 [Colletotrichum sublineola]